MIEGILSFLVDIGLISADWYHRRNIKKLGGRQVKRIGTGKENNEENQSDSKRQHEPRDHGSDSFNRPGLLTPSAIVYGMVLGGILVAGFIWSYYNNSVSKPNATMLEMERILESAENWKERKGVYPESIKVLTNVRPHRNTWMTDEWDVEYHLVTSNGTFEIISAGSDKKLNTRDDISSADF